MTHRLCRGSWLEAAVHSLTPKEVWQSLMTFQSSNQIGHWVHFIGLDFTKAGGIASTFQVVIITLWIFREFYYYGYLADISV